MGILEQRISWGNSLSVHTCSSETAYEEVDKTTTNDSSISVGDTTITLTSGTGFNVGDIINFGEVGGHEYRITVVLIQTTLLLLDFISLQVQADYITH